MKISYNLSAAQGFRERHLLAWSIPLFVASLLILVHLVFVSQANWRQYGEERRAADAEEARQNDFALREAALKHRLDRPETRDLLREVQFVNSVIDDRRLSFTDLTAKVTDLLPPQARLAALSMPDTTGDPVVHFGIEGASEEPVETFLTNLEESPDFRDVVLLSQGFEEKGNGAPVSITLSARYVGGRVSSGSSPAREEKMSEAKNPEEKKLDEKKSGEKTPAASKARVSPKLELPAGRPAAAKPPNAAAPQPGPTGSVLPKPGANAAVPPKPAAPAGTPPQ